MANRCAVWFDQSLLNLIHCCCFPLTTQSSPVHPGWVTYNYERILTDVLGFQNVGLGMFGMLKGRTSVIQTVYFDNDVWIETGKDGSYDYFNVYVREIDSDDCNA